MRFLVSLVSLGVERFFNIQPTLNRFNWFGSYITKIQNKVKGMGTGMRIACLLIPIPIAVFIIEALFGHWLSGLVQFLWSICVVTYCLGPKHLSRIIVDSKTGSDGENTLGKEQMTSWLFAANTNWAGVILWYMFLGVFGAALYRVSVLLAEHAKQEDSCIHDLSEYCDYLQSILDWLPARVLGFLYALCGSLKATLGYWTKNVFTGFDSTQEMLKQCGLHSLGFSKEEISVSDDNIDAVGQLIDRSMIAYLILFALLTVI